MTALEELESVNTSVSCESRNLRSNAIIGGRVGVAVAVGVAVKAGEGVIVAGPEGETAATAAVGIGVGLTVAIGDAPGAGAALAVPSRSHSVLPESLAITAPRILPVNTIELLPTKE